MNNKLNTFFCLALILLVTLSCKIISNLQDIAPDSGVQNNEKLAEPADIWLNDEKMGTTDDLSKFVEKSKQIKQQRENDGVFAPDSNEINFQVYMHIKANVLLKKLVKLASVQNTVLPKKSLKTVSGPEPLLLVGTIQEKGLPQPTTPKYPTFVRSDIVRFTISEFEGAHGDLSLKENLRLNRIMNSSIQISASGDYFFNTRYTQDELSKLSSMDGLSIRQEKISKEQLKTKLPKFTAKEMPNALEVLAADNLDFESIRVLKDLIEDTKIDGIRVKLIPKDID